MKKEVKPQTILEAIKEMEARKNADFLKLYGKLFVKEYVINFTESIKRQGHEAFLNEKEGKKNDRT